MPSFITQPVNVGIFTENIYKVSLTVMDEKTKFELPSTQTLKKQPYVSSWAIAEKFQITLHSIQGLNCDMSKETEVGIQVGLFHGGKSLCEPQKTNKMSMQADECVQWDQVFKFDIHVYDVPKMARLCLVVYEIAKTSGGRRKGKEASKYSYNPLAWVNTTVFDYKNQLKTGAMTLYTWTYAEDSQSDDLLHPLGTVESNPMTDERAAIMLSIHK